VSAITPKGNPESKTFRVYLLLPRDTPLRIGMTTEVNIVYRENPDALVVPTEAISNNAVSIVNGDRTSRVRVAVGVRGSRLVEVIGGIPEGAMVVSPARSDIAEGSSVRIDLLPDIVIARAQPSEVADAKSSRPNFGGTRSTVTDGPALTSAPPSPGAPDSASADLATGLPAAEVDQAISAALSARVLSIVNDARRKLDDPSGK
jgi:hypothetical protein